MARSNTKTKVADKLAVDGTPKLAAKGHPGDKHDKANLNIEEATVASPRATRQRAGDYFDFDDEKEPKVDASSKSADTQAAKLKKTKTAPAKKREKSGKGKGEAEVDDADVGESIGQRVAAEPAKPSKGKKDATEKENVVIGPSGDTAAVEGVAAPEKEKRQKKAKAEPKKGKKGKDDTGDADTGETLEDRVKAEPAKTKGKKSVPAKDDVVVGPSGDTAAVESVATTEKEAKPKRGRPATKDKATPKEKVAPKEKAPSKDKTPTTKATKNDGKLPTEEKKRKSSKADKDDSKGAAGEGVEPAKGSKKAAKDTVASGNDPKGKGPAKAGGAEPKPKPKKSKATTEKDADGEKSPAVEPDLAMDQGPFESLLESDTGKPSAAKPSKAARKKATKINSTEKPAMDTAAPKPDSTKPSSSKTTTKAADTLTKEVAAGAEKAKKEAAGAAEKVKKAVKPKADPKKALKDSSVALKDVVSKTATPAESAAREASKSKKRKDPPSADADTVKRDLLDPLAEHASASKKQKQSKKSLGETVGSIISTSFETARKSLGGLTGAGAITDNTPDLASAVIDAKNTAKAASKKTKGKGKAAGEPPADVGAAEEDDAEEEADDQTAALLAGFESDADEADVPSTGFEEGAPIPSLPNGKETSKSLAALKQSKGKTEKGVVYLGRIPHGFYEHQMRAYFSQFGPIARLRLSRNKRTGASRHYAFVEFEQEGVARIVANTMDNYLMFGHQLKCKFVEKANVHEELWKGAGKRFKAVPWNKIEGKKLEVPLGKGEWAGKVEKEKKRRTSKLEKAKEVMGYEGPSGVLKGVEAVAKKAIGTTEVEEEKSLITAGQEGGVVVSEEVKTTTQKGKGGESKTTVKKTKRAAETEEGGAAKKARKGKKAEVAAA